MALRPYNLNWMIEDEALVILTQDKANASNRTRIYLVRNLVQSRSGMEVEEDPDSLIELITSTGMTQTWSDVGGPGTLQYFPNAGTLVVTQTREVHDQIERLLVTLRQARDEQGFRRTSPSVVSTSINRTHPTVPSPARQYAAAQPWNQPRLHQ